MKAFVGARRVLAHGSLGGGLVGQVEWSELEGEQAETLLAVLLYNEHPQTTRVRPSQGDFGIDVLNPNSAEPDTFDVYQIKKFAQSPTASQKGQIDKSFRRLLIGLVRRSVPLADWYLLMPLDPTVDNFLDWFNAMPNRVISAMFNDQKLALNDDEKAKITAWKNADGRVIKWEGRPLCVTLASKYPYVVDYYLHGGQQRILKAFADLSSIYLADSSIPDPSTAGTGTSAVLTPAQLQNHLFKLQEVLDTDPHFRYGISLDHTQPEITVEPDLVAATQVIQADGRTLTVRIKQRFAEALRERPIPIKVKFLATDATFDQQAFEMWQKYGTPLVAAPAEVDIDLPGGLGSGQQSDAVSELTILGSPGLDYEARFRIRKPDGPASEDGLLFSLSAATGPAGTGIWEKGTDTTGLLTFESLSDLESGSGTWTFKRESIVGRELVVALPIIQFLQDLSAPNVLQAAKKYGPYVDHHKIPDTQPPFPASVMQFLRALADLQDQTDIPIVIPDLTTVTEDQLKAVTEASVLVSGQHVIDTWDRIKMAPAGEVPTESEIAGPQQEIDFSKEYQLLVAEELVVKVGGQTLKLGTVSSLLLSAKYAVEGDLVVASPYRNNTMQRNFSPLLDPAAQLGRHVMGRMIGPINVEPGE